MEETAIMKAEATLKYARISARKVKIVADLIRGKNVDEALAIVKFTPKASSEILEKLLKSAIANAENNHGMNRGNLIVSEIYANQGPTLTPVGCTFCPIELMPPFLLEQLLYDLSFFLF